MAATCVLDIGSDNVIPERLSLRNFMCYREELPPLEFDGLHVACLSGDNGSGKSALLDAITWSLWGKARLSSDDELIAVGAQDMEVDFQFGLNGHTYRVVRKRSRSKRGQSSLDFQMRNGSGWKVLTEATLRETQQAVSSTLKIDYDTFINSAFLLQGRADEFTSRKKPAERKQVLAEILGLTEYDVLQQAARDQAAEFERQAFGKQALLGDLQRRADDAPKYQALLEQTNLLLAGVEQELATLEAQRAAVAERQRLLATQQDMLHEARRQQQEVDAELAHLAGELATLTRRIGEGEALQARRDAITAGIAALDTAEQELTALDALQPTYQALLDERRAAQEQLTAHERELRMEAQLLTRTLQELDERAAEHAHTQERIAKGERLVAELVPQLSELHQLREQRAELSRRELLLRELETQRRDIEERITLRKQSLIASREEAQRTIRRLEARIADQTLWQRQFDAARRAVAELDQLQQTLDAQRSEETAAVEAVGALRAEQRRIEQQGKELREKLASLKTTDHDAATCPLCQSDLGHAGIARLMQQYEHERDQLRTQLVAVRETCSTHEATLTQHRTHITATETHIADLRHTAAQVHALEQRLSEAAADRAELRHQNETLATIVEQLEQRTYAEVEQRELAAVEAELAAAGGSSAALREQAELLSTHIADLERQSARIERYQGELAALGEKLAALDVELARRPAATAALAALDEQLASAAFGAEARQVLAEVDARLAALGYQREAYEAARQAARELRVWRAEAQQLQQTDALLHELGAQQQRCQEAQQRRTSELAAIAARIAQLGASMHDLTEAEQQAQVLDGQIGGKRSQRDAALSDRSQYHQRLGDAEDAREALAVEQFALHELRAQQGLYEELAQCFGKKGVQAMLIETAIPELEHEANRLLSRMTDNQMHLTFETQRDTKKGDTVETLDIKIADALGTRAYEAFSGGEAFRVNFAVRVALARLLARRTGANLETLVIDEGFGTQDAKGRERLVDAITSVQDDFRRILVVTHIQELKDLFPAQIEINKTDSGSVWSIS
jgi:DNA repair protein SbcC/Rad50